MSALWPLLGPSPYAEDVEKVLDVFAAVALPRHAPVSLRITIAEGYALVRFTATRGTRTATFENYAEQLRELDRLAARWGQSGDQSRSAWWAELRRRAPIETGHTIGSER